MTSHIRLARLDTAGDPDFCFNAAKTSVRCYLMVVRKMREREDLTLRGPKWGDLVDKGRDKSTPLKTIQIILRGLDKQDRRKGIVLPLNLQPTR